MTTYSSSFDLAINHVMLYEVGGFFTLTPDVMAGKIDTDEQKRACGYTNDPVDPGGETKFGIAKNANPDLDVTNLDWEGAKRVYFKRYWLQGDCQNMSGRLAALHFDGGVNNGVGRAAKFVQIAANVTADGDIGPATIAAINAQDEITLCNSVCDQRVKFYNDIVAAKPSQQKYINGWMRRINEMRTFVTDLTVTF